MRLRRDVRPIPVGGSVVGTPASAIPEVAERRSFLRSQGPARRIAGREGIVARLIHPRALALTGHEDTIVLRDEQRN